MFVHYDEIGQALIDISSDKIQSDDSCSDVCRLEPKINKLEIAHVTVIWNTIIWNTGTFQRHQFFFTEF